MTTPTFEGIVRDGQIKPDRPFDFQRWVASLEGARVQFSVKKRRSKFSNQQGRYWFGVVIPLLAEHFGYDREERKALHYQLMAMCFGTRTETRLGVEMEVVNVESMTQLNTQQFEEMSDWARRWAAKEHGVYIPEPNEEMPANEDFDLRTE